MRKGKQGGMNQEEEVVVADSPRAEDEELDSLGRKHTGFERANAIEQEVENAEDIEVTEEVQKMLEDYEAGVKAGKPGSSVGLGMDTTAMRGNAAPQVKREVDGMDPAAAEGRMDDDNEEDLATGPLDVLSRAKLDLEEAKMRVGKAFKPNLELILKEMDTATRQATEHEAAKLGHATVVYSSDKIIITGFTQDNFRNDYPRVVTEVQQLLVDYSITCDVSDIVPEILQTDRLRCDLLVYI